MDANRADVLKALNGKAFIVLGAKDGKYLVLQTTTGVMKVITTQSFGTIFKDVGNAKLEGGVPKVTDISTTRLAELMGGNVLNFSYIVARYRDEKTGETLGYLSFVFQNKTHVKLVKLDAKKSLELFEYGKVLNAKKVTRDGKEIISGIQQELPEIEMTSVQKEENVEEPQGVTERQKKKFLDKTEKRFLGNFKCSGYSTSPRKTRDWQVSVQRLLNERIFLLDRRLKAWYEEKPSQHRAVQVLDAYFASKAVNNEIAFTVSTAKLYSNATIYKRHTEDDNEESRGITVLGLDKSLLERATVVLIYAPTSVTGTESSIDNHQLNPNGKTLITYTQRGVISTSPVDAIKDISALEEGLNNGEIEMFTLKGVLTDPSIPTDDSVKELLNLRDKTALEFDIVTRANKINDNTNSRNTRGLLDKYKTIPAKRGSNLYNELLKMAKNTYNYENPKEERVYTQVINIENVTWDSVEALVAFNIELASNGDTIEKEYGFRSDFNADELVDKFYPNNAIDLKGVISFSGKTVKLPKELKGTTNIKCVGDVILTNLIIGDTLTNHFATAQKQKMFALLALGNKALALEVAQVLNSGVSEADDLEVDINKLQVMQETLATNQYYLTGGRIGDDHKELGYNNYITFRHINEPNPQTMRLIMYAVYAIFKVNRTEHSTNHTIYR